MNHPNDKSAASLAAQSRAVCCRLCQAPLGHTFVDRDMHVPILPVEAIDEAKPGYLLVLPWNLRDEIIQQLRHVGDWGCQFVIPIPHVHVVKPSGNIQ